MTPIISYWYAYLICLSLTLIKLIANFKGAYTNLSIFLLVILSLNFYPNEKIEEDELRLY